MQRNRSRAALEAVFSGSFLQKKAPLKKKKKGGASRPHSCDGLADLMINHGAPRHFLTQNTTELDNSSVSKREVIARGVRRSRRFDTFGCERAQIVS